MTDTHVVSALKEKRIQVASQIESLQGQLRRAVIDLDHVEAALRLFDPDVDMAALSPRKVAPVLYDTKGDTGRIILETLRTATKPLTTEQVCLAVMKARNLDDNDKALCRLMMRRTNANLKHWATPWKNTSPISESYRETPQLGESADFVGSSAPKFLSGIR